MGYLDEAKKLAELQKKYNQEAAALAAQYNRYDVYNPGGSSKWVQNPDGRWYQETTLSPAEQKAYNQRVGLDQSRNDLAEKMFHQYGKQQYMQPFSYDGLQKGPGTGDFGKERQRVEDAVYGRFAKRLDPFYRQEAESLEQKLVEQGNQRGSPKFEEAMDRFFQRRGDAYTDATNQAVLTGSQEHSRMFGLGGQARDRATREATDLRSMPIREIGAILGQPTAYSQGPQLPSSPISPGNVDAGGIGTNLYAAEQQAKAAAAQQALAQQQFGLAQQQFGFDQQKWQDALNNQPSSSGFADVAANVGGSFASGYGQGYGATKGAKK